MGMKRKIFREGQRFGKLIVISYENNKKYLCLCDCGNKKIIRTGALTSKQISSCGCLRSINRQDYDEDMKKKLINSIKISLTGCWEWQKSKHKQGYGQFSYKRKVLHAHRVSWILFKGKLPDNILVCHKCDNPSCCNPEHLFLGTDKENFDDAMVKGRIKRSRGESHYHSKLSECDVKNIRQMRREKVTVKEISEKYFISYSQVKKIANGSSWKHVH